MKTYHVIKIKYLGRTNNLGSRIKLVSERFNSRKTIGYNYSFNSSYDGAVDYLKKTHNILGVAEGKDCYYILTDTFKPIV